MKALLIGLGGIGSNVYLPELIKLGYTVDTVDPLVSGATFEDIKQVTDSYDVAVICTPNFTHDSIARLIAEKVECIFIEKPGLPSSSQWNNLCEDFPNTKFIMCKNNLYRSNYGAIDDFLKGDEELISVDITWFNANRVPNPGGWSTQRRKAWGGVALDLFPHLYCHMIKLFGGVPEIERSSHSMAQQWVLSDLEGSDYGTVIHNGVFNVCDYAQETWYIADKYPVNVKASWKQGYDDQSVKVYTENSMYQWNFGLCPAEAYGSMIAVGMNEPYELHRHIDSWIHKNLEAYHEG
jgi:predicted dehydrogenase|tara:strand:+ start:3183 stop:4064 length:882 start_codon:yes stop_codon:yes gene_type:complete